MSILFYSREASARYLSHCVRFVGLLVLLPGAVLAQPSIIGGLTGSGAFGTSVMELPNGNFVVTDPGYDTGGVADVGAVYLYRGTDNALLSTLTGSTANDRVGSSGITMLSNGNFLVRSPNWDGVAANVGAVTWGNASTGVSGAVSAANSLVGSTANDNVGTNIVALPNGNYVVGSPGWDNGPTVTNVGAATWGSGTGGTAGAVSAANSLVGSTANDNVGSNIVALPNGNYVVGSPGWDNGMVINAGAATWGSGTGGTAGAVSAANSLVGATTNDNVGSNGITALANGNYVVGSPGWNNGLVVVDVGAATWGSGMGGTAGAVSTANSLVGTTAHDNVGSNGITPLANGNYVVGSPSWNNGSIVVDAGAATWGNGATGTVGTVSAVNSLVGTTTTDRVSSNNIVALANGNYVVSSAIWDNGPAVVDAGAATWGNGAGGTAGVVSVANSLIGTTTGDFIGNNSITALANGNYVVRSSRWDNGPAVVDAGAATWGNGTGGTAGAVSAANSLVGTTTTDNVGSNGVVALANGNYVVSSAVWDNDNVVNAGAATWGNGATGTAGTVSAANSLVGTTATDFVGSNGVAALTNGNYVVGSSNWNDGVAANVGAATWGNGVGGTAGAVSTANSLVGTITSDNVGNNGITALSDGNYVVYSSNWDNGDLINAGALTLGNGSDGTTGPVTACNSIAGGIASKGFNLVFAYHPATTTLPATLLGGLRNENKVQVGTGPPAAPSGAVMQCFALGATVASLVATGTAVQFFATSSGGTALASTTPLVNGTTYYAGQTVSGCPSFNRLAIAVTAPLPVELTAFTATPKGNAAVRLAWATASEHNSARFEVERSADGRGFATIRTVAAAGNSACRYELLDAQLPANTTTLYYRLRQVDVDSTFGFSPVRAVLLRRQPVVGLALAPNPARTTTLAGAEAGASVEVYDILGRRVLTATADAAGTAPLVLPAGLATGVYVVHSGAQAVRLVVE